MDRVLLTESVVVPSAPEINVLPGSSATGGSSSYVFSAQNLNVESAPVVFTIENTGDQPLSITTPLQLSGANANQFQITKQPESTIAVGGTSTFEVVFKPTSVLDKFATISIANNDPNENPYTINLSGEGVLLPPTISSFDPSAGPIGATIKILGSNLTNTELVLFENGTSTGRSAVFKVVDDNTITATVPAGATSGNVKISYNKGGSTTTSVATFAVQFPEINVLPGSSATGGSSSYVFSAQNLNVESAPVVFTIENTGDQPLSITTPLQLSGANANQFQITKQPESTIAVGGTSTFEVVFKPTSVLDKFATISIANNDPNENPYTINLSGEGVILPPTISSFDPELGAIGATIRILGSNFTNTSGVIFQNGKTAVFRIIDDKTIEATVPEGSITGPVTLAYDNSTKTTTSQASFSVEAGPVITDFTPKSGPVGTVVTIKGGNFWVDGMVYFKDANGNNTYPSFYEYVSSTEVKATVPADAATGLLTVEGEFGVTESATVFTLTVPAPAISTVSPNSGPDGTVVQVTGTNLKGITAVTINGITAAYKETTQGFTTVVPADAPVGKGLLVVTTAGGTAQAEFTVTVPMPIITDFTPKSGPVGTVVTIIGRNFWVDGMVYFKDANGNNTYPSFYEYVSSTEVKATVPADAATGLLTVEGEFGTVESQTAYTLSIPAPVIAKLDPNAGLPGTVIKVTGADLKGITNVTINGTKASWKETAEGFTTVVPDAAPAGNGKLEVTTAGGTDDAVFTVLEPAPLPVELMDFAGKGSSKGITLTWKTASEKDNAYFEVQASANPTKENFVTIGRVDSKVTNSSVVQSYEFMDRAPRGPVTYYRLKQVDLDGASELSNVIAVKRALTGSSNAQVKVYPNPFVQNLNLEVEAAEAGQMNVVLYYVTGKKAFEQVISVEKGAAVVELPLGNASLSAGIYILTTEINGQVTTSRVVKQ
ncbi:hypothetical protein GCM10027189_27430 [Rufibacter soli]